MPKSRELSEIWEKDFGEAYTKRKLLVHQTEARSRQGFWNGLVKKLPDAATYLEIGCNAGMNLEAIYKTGKKLKIYGIEPNDYAFSVATKRAKGRYRVLKNNIFDIPPKLKADLVFTCTVLIHIAPDDLRAAMEKVYKASNKYILSMEYYWPVVTTIEYRGHRDILWKRDFGAQWMRNFNVKLIETGYLGARDGFDRVTWWLFKK